MDLHTVLVDPTCEAVPPQWDEFVSRQRLISLWGSGPLTTAAWCGQTPTLMAVVEDLAGVPLALFHTRHIGLPTAPHRFHRPGGDRVVGLVECRMHPVNSPPAYAFAPQLDRADRAAVLDSFERAVRRRLGWRCAGLVYRQVNDEDLPLMRRGGWVSRPAWPAMSLHNQWSSITDYLAALPKKVRWQARKTRTRLDADPTLRVSLESELPAESLAKMVHVVRERYRRRFTIQPAVPVHYMSQLSQAPDTQFLVYRDSTGRTLAFVVIHDDGTDLHSSYWGTLDRVEGGRADLYFDQYLRSVELLVERGRRRLTLGKGMNDIKARYGCQPERRYVVAGRG